jgi:glutaredoxin 2
MRGNSEALEFCVDRATEMYDGSPGFWTKDAEQNLPALMTDEQFTISNLTNGQFLESVVSEFEFDEVVPNKIREQIKTMFGFDYIEHYFTVMNNTSDWEELWEDSLELSKEDYVRTYLLNSEFAKDNQLLFPNLSNFDSVNPIFWNTILRKNIAWLDKYKVKNGTYNQTN